MAGRIGVIGEKDSVGCFKTLGLDVFEEVSARGVARTVNRMAKEKYAVIFVTEQAYVQAQETILKYNRRPYPAIIPIPSGTGSLGMGLANIQKNVEKAVGTELFLDD
jgi:V/A-type H+-transporting ATPase subunit F